MVRMLEELYKNTKAVVWSAEGRTDEFKTVCGVKQGCLLSPLLFSLFLNDVEDSGVEGV